MSLAQRLSRFGSRFTTRQKVVAGVSAVVLVAAGTVGGLVATSGSSAQKPTAAPPPPPVTTSARPTPTPKPTLKPKPKPKPKPVNPLTGAGAPPKGPVLAVKIDDTGNGRPQVGLEQADIVYIEQAEGGLTRLLAVYGTRKPVVEPVRSVRASDPELLTQYGPISLVASGGGGDSLTVLGRSIIHGVINDAGGPGFSRDGARSAPYNLQSNLAAVSSAVHSGGSKSIGFTWAKAVRGLAARPSGLQVRTVVGGTSVAFNWSSRLGRYVRVIEGVAQNAASGAPIATPNVIVQFCQVTVNPADVDVAGNPSQYTHTVGHGRVAVFRNGHRIDGTWTRAKGGSGTTLLDSHRQPIPLAPGGAWVVLVANNAPL